ncbi:transcriptional regulator ArgP [Desulfonema ishimotonii]|uniref:Transcriptional regulator ArgP n=1 Tax=Desulfonema ishimotonii TaxID=45657 RepID=A0A401G328_9BACT|nr:LysR family transcriptional regulator ArgP [Desulfonema ishimotonii]GBC63652.1 transcriptional regulator ArgP [Desulfonema ishimotonii]
MLDYKLIEALAMVVREGGFDRAAKALCLTQSAISQRVRLLEEQTGQILLARTAPPCATQAGQQIIRHYLQVKQLEDDLMEDVIPAWDGAFTVMPLGVNADSLTTWFMEAVRPFLRDGHVVLDIRTDDQEQTHRLLKDGDVMGCISIREQPIQGCRADYLGRMEYRLLATPEFAATWFPAGLTRAAVGQTPTVIFNRRDRLQEKLFGQVLREMPAQIPAHYLPSPEKFAELITSGLAYGMLPDLQSRSLADAGRLVDLAPSHSVSVRLYWHCWNINSRLLRKFTAHLIAQARILLGQ